MHGRQYGQHGKRIFRGRGCTGWVLVSFALAGALGVLAGCRAERPDVPADAARLTGLENAIVFREDPLPPDPPAPADPALTPEQAIRLALARDPRVQSSLAKVRVAEADAN